MHTAYMPYVDVVRCDAHAATIAHPVAEGGEVRIARTSEQVLSLVEGSSPAGLPGGASLEAGLHA